MFRNRTFDFLIFVLILSFLFTCSKDKKNPTSPENHNPKIHRITANPSEVGIQQNCTLTAVATDEDGDSLNFVWSADGGSFLDGNSSNPIVWKAPNTAGDYECRVMVSDGKEVDEDTIVVKVVTVPLLNLSTESLEFGDLA